MSLPQQCISNQFEVTCIDKRSFFSKYSEPLYVPITFQGLHVLAEMLESNILYDNLLIDILSV